MCIRVSIVTILEYYRLCEDYFFHFIYQIVYRRLRVKRTLDERNIRIGNYIRFLFGVLLDLSKAYF